MSLLEHKLFNRNGLIFILVALDRVEVCGYASVRLAAKSRISEIRM